MSSIKLIRSKIRSVENTGKITRAMEMVAASKMRRAQERLSVASLYFDQLKSLLAAIVADYEEELAKEKLLVQPIELKSVYFIIVSSDKGLCGGLNSNLFRYVLARVAEYTAKGTHVKVITIGRKASVFFSRLADIDVKAMLEGLSDQPDIFVLSELLTDVLNGFLSQDFQEVRVFHNEFVNRMKQEPSDFLLMPLSRAVELGSSSARNFLVEPDVHHFFFELSKRYLIAALYRSVVENMACEQSSRMVAMKSASDNVKGMVHALRLEYNRSRQASITKEISEIVGGGTA